MKRMLILLLLVVGGLCQLVAQEVNTSVDKVYVVFKTHLDVGFTDLSSVVTQRYITEFIPKALDVSEKLRAENASEKYVWTNRRRLSSQQPFENAGDVKAENAKSLKELKSRYSQCVEERKLPLILYYGTDRII